MITNIITSLYTMIDIAFSKMKWSLQIMNKVITPEKSERILK